MRDPRKGLLVAAANLEARRLGVRPLMRLVEATTLVAGCGSMARVLEHDPQEDIEALCTLAEQAQQFSPIVGLEQLDKKLWSGRHLAQPECLMLDVTGIGKLFGSEAKLLEEISKWLAQQNYFGCLGIAGSVGAAWAIANFALRGSQETQPSAAPDSNISHHNSADGKSPIVPTSRARIIPPGVDPENLTPLPLAALRIPSDTIDSLHRLGVRNVGQLDALPRHGMATRLGDQLMLRWDQAFDRKEEPVITLYGSPDWCLEQTLEYPTLERATMEELVRRLTGKLAKRLEKRGEGALRIVCRLDFVESQPLILQLGLFRPTNDAAHLESLLNGQMEQALKRNLEAPMWRLNLQASMTSSMVWRQTDLFDGSDAGQRNHVARLIDTLSGRLGRKNVTQAKTKRESQPELAFTTTPLTGRQTNGIQRDTLKKLSSRIARNRAEPSRDDPLRRPSHLLDPPQEIQVGFDDKDQVRLATAPQRFRFQNQMHSIVESWGPERLESGWWRGPSNRRDYYRVQTQNGSWWWIFRDLQTSQWCVHGIFD